MDIDFVRSQFPALADGYIYADNAGGSQCNKGVIDAITDYLCRTNVQLGADYSIGVKSTTRVSMGPAATALLVNSSSPSEIIFSNASTQLSENLARALEHTIRPDGEDEFIAMCEHETNVGPWQKLAGRTRNKLLFWNPTRIQDAGSNQDGSNPYAVGYLVENLIPLLSSKTRLVALSACSNILGSFMDIKNITKIIRETVHERSGGLGRVEVVVDCVAYAPHRRIDVRDWDVDYAFFSYYKVYGPHIAAMYVRAGSAQSSLGSISHYFITDPTNRLQLGGPGYELTYAISRVLPYLMSIGNANTSDSSLVEKVISSTDELSIGSALTKSFDAIAKQESTLVERLIGFLTEKKQWNRGIRVVGGVDLRERAPTISFVVVEGKDGEPAMRSQDIVAGVDAQGGIGIRFGHFYAARLIEFLGLPETDGVVRVSLVHYNTLEEVDAIITALKKAIGLKD
ncbi:hypothetical protein FRC18_004677 [Serendipita sp. 400]|nr:hypothetical protein FRC18_004677 [Serendipita sp. 400]